jgi:hypothetical protein
LVLVHGRDFKPAANEFLDLSLNALSSGLERDFPQTTDAFYGLQKRLGYYGDITDEFLASQGLRYDEALDASDRRNALTSLRAITKKKNFGVARYDRLPGKTAMGEFAADVFAPILSRIGLARKLIEKVGVDLGEYWNKKSDFGSRVSERVRNTICEALDDDGDVLLISHGTGCIVTYDVLWQLSNDPKYSAGYKEKKIDAWLTIGAPLGDSMVAKRLLGARRKGFSKYPSNIVSWHNLAAEDDFMSHDNTLADDFKPMLRQKQVSCIRDYRIYNLAVRYGKSNPHSSIGYLIHPRTVQIVAEWLQQGQVEPLPTNIF